LFSPEVGEKRKYSGWRVTFVFVVNIDQAGDIAARTESRALLDKFALGTLPTRRIRLASCTVIPSLQFEFQRDKSAHIRPYDSEAKMASEL
jgi:hypothetical protein